MRVSWYVLALVILAALIFLSLRYRVHLIRMARQEPSPELPSPAAEAIKHLVGVAGGIYVSLVSLAAFLALPLPKSIQLGTMSFDPLALAALLIAIVQPFFVR